MPRSTTAERTGVVGDSIAGGFDADTDLCRYMDEPEHSFATGVDHGGAPGGDGTFSHAERGSPA